MITVRARPGGGGWLCDVTIEVGGQLTEHEVAVTAADLARWGEGSGEEDVRRLVEKSFEFLLEREPPSSILRRFDLSVIQRYFPEYEQVIRAG